ncbi:MAG: hypothetical protein F4051_04980 [Boseongicola sp. SB0670_bin_30]|nr:hypothetical protein [Boseongicola sp. SB0670_bin_30]
MVSRSATCGPQRAEAILMSRHVANMTVTGGRWIRHAARRSSAERLVALRHHIAVPVLADSLRPLTSDVAVREVGVT